MNPKTHNTYTFTGICVYNMHESYKRTVGIYESSSLYIILWSYYFCNISILHSTRGRGDDVIRNERTNETRARRRRVKKTVSLSA